MSGVETTSGPLGQGVATSVGMAIARKWLAQRYNQPGFDVFDYNIYSVCVGASGQVIGMQTFGASAPLKELQKKFGFEPDRLVTIAKELLTGERTV